MSIRLRTDRPASLRAGHDLPAVATYSPRRADLAALSLAQRALLADSECPPGSDRPRGGYGTSISVAGPAWRDVLAALDAWLIEAEAKTAAEEAEAQAAEASYEATVAEVIAALGAAGGLEPLIAPTWAHEGYALRLIRLASVQHAHLARLAADPRCADLIACATAEAALRQRQAEIAEAEAEATREATVASEAAALEAERAEWIAAHGSERLRLAHSCGCLEAVLRSYDEERLEATLPGWQYLRTGDPDPREIREPTLAALRALADGRTDYSGGGSDCYGVARPLVEELELGWLPGTGEILHGQWRCGLAEPSWICKIIHEGRSDNGRSDED